MKWKMILLIALIVTVIFLFFYFKTSLKEKENEITELKKNIELLKKETKKQEENIKLLKETAQAFEKIENIKEANYNKNSSVIKKYIEITKSNEKDNEKQCFETDDWILWSRVNELFNSSNGEDLYREKMSDSSKTQLSDDKAK